MREHLHIQEGFGPLQEDAEIELRPLTIFFGPQGSGKSLVSQVLYFFRDAPYLLSRYGGEATSAAALVRKVVQGIRAGDSPARWLTAFLSKRTVHLSYTESQTQRKLSFRRDTREIVPLQPFAHEIAKWVLTWREDPQQRPRERRALFIPAERVLLSRFVNTESALLAHDAVPYTLREFAFFLQAMAERWFQGDRESFPYEEDAEEIRKWTQDALGGHERYEGQGPFAGKWQWAFTAPEGKRERKVEIEMAATGQMEAWPLIFTARVLAAADKERVSVPSFIHLEEPEAHLHPRAQVRLAWVLARLVRLGFRVLVTTHSLTFLYAVNNLILAHKLFNTATDAEPPLQAPPKACWLSPEQVRAYVFDLEAIRTAMNEKGEIEESLLSEVLGRLEEEYYALWSLAVKTASHPPEERV